MTLSDNHFRTAVDHYLSRINGNTENRVADALLESLSAQQVRSIEEQDLEMLVNQFFNLVCFGPVTNLELFVTEDCNLSCGYCFVRKKNKVQMPFDRIVAAINFLVFYSGNQKDLNLTLFGGEPLMARQSIIRVVDYIRDLESRAGNKRIQISITTNGTLLDEELLEHTYGKAHYLLSMDGDRESHDRFRKFRNGRGSYTTVASRIGMLKKYQPWLGARLTITPQTADRMSRNIRMLYDLGINQFLLGPALDMAWDEKALHVYEQQLKLTGRFYIKKKKEGKPIRMTLFEQALTGAQCHAAQWGCGAGRNTLSVATNGDIYPCSKFLGYESFNDPALKLGTLYEGITNIPLRRKLAGLTDTDFPGCKGCVEINSCRGGCPADNYQLNRNVFVPGKAHCAIKKIESRVLRDLGVSGPA